MAEYINRECLLGAMQAERERLRPLYDNYALGFEEGILLVKGFPYADVVPVVHGLWKSYHEADIGYDEYGVRCSNCLFEVEDNEVNFRMHYCPNCGAKMDMEE